MHGFLIPYLFAFVNMMLWQASEYKAKQAAFDADFRAEMR